MSRKEQRASGHLAPSQGPETLSEAAAAHRAHGAHGHESRPVCIMYIGTETGTLSGHARLHPSVKPVAGECRVLTSFSDRFKWLHRSRNGYAAMTHSFWMRLWKPAMVRK